MNILKVCISTVSTLLALGASSFPQAANLQSQDLFFFSTHKKPVQVVGDSKNAYILTESGVLIYDYRRSAWADNLAPNARVEAIRYSSARSKVYLQLVGGRILEYNSTFRRLIDASSSDYQAADGSGASVDLNGLNLDGNNFFLGDAIRDKYMRRAPIIKSNVFEYDNLWVLTDGFGPFFGSARRKSASSFWFGLEEKSAKVIYHQGGNVWFGSCRTDLSPSDGQAGSSNGALIRAKADLTDWKVYPAQLETGFGDGCIHDIKEWKGYIWLATERGVVRHDPATGQFMAFTNLMGASGIRVNQLHVHEGFLYAATEEGVAYLIQPSEDFQSTETMNQGGLPVYDLVSKDKDLWAATRLGLFVHQASGWKDLKAVSGKDVPEATLITVPSVAYHDSSLYWISGNKIMIKPKKQLPKVLLERDQPSRIRFDGDKLFIAYATGITIYDLQKKLWTEFKLEDGIPGRQVLTFSLDAGKLWMGTDEGVMRINYKSYLP